MAYHVLNERTLIDYLRGRPAVVRRFPRGADLGKRRVLGDARHHQTEMCIFSIVRSARGDGFARL